MNMDPVRVSRIEFLQAAPWLRLGQAVRLGTGLQTLLTAALTVLACSALESWWPDTAAETGGRLLTVSPDILPQPLAAACQTALRAASGELLPRSVRLLVLVTLIGISGIAVARCTGVSVARGQREGFLRSLRHVFRQRTAFLIATGLTLLCLTFGLAFFRLSLLFTRFDAGVATDQWTNDWPGWCGACVFLFLFALSGSGWLMSLSAIGVDSTDGAESLSRGISYVLSRFSWFVFCVALTIIISRMTGVISDLVFSSATRLLDQSSTTPAATGVRWSEVLAAVPGRAIHYSVFLCGMTISYFLLRNIEDGVPLDELRAGEPGS